MVKSAAQALFKYSIFKDKTQRLQNYSLVMQNLPTAKSGASNVVYVENGFLKLS